MNTDQTPDRNPDTESESYLRLGDRGGEGTEIDVEVPEEVTVPVKHKHEGVRFDATLDGDGYLRGSHDRYFPTALYAIVDEPTQ
jgi:hypothetical protein